MMISRITRDPITPSKNNRQAPNYLPDLNRDRQPARAFPTVRDKSRRPRPLPHLLGGQIANKRDLVKLVVVGLIHQENPVGEDGQRD